MVATMATRLHPLGLALALLATALIGGVIASNIPFGAKRMTLAYGTAHVLADGHGSFMPEGGSAILLPAEIPWADKAGNLTHGGRPDCLKGDPEGGAHGIPVEAGYVEAALPDGKGSMRIVAWIRCR